MTLTPTRRDEFDDDTSYERLVLDMLFDVLASFRGRDVEGSCVDLRQPGGVIVDTGTVRGERGPRPDWVALLRPLAFGAAYKIIDLLVELAHEIAVGPSPRLSYQTKRGFVSSGGFALPPPLIGDQGLAARVARLYIALEDGRHSVAHRRLGYRADGTVIPHDDAGNPLRPIKPALVDALAQLANGLAEAVVTGVIDERQTNALCWHVDQLTELHLLPSLGAERHEVSARPIVAFLTVENGQVLPAVDRVRSYAAAHDPPPSGFTRVIFMSKDGYAVTAPLRRVPESATAFPLSCPPDWVDDVSVPLTD